MKRIPSAYRQIHTKIEVLKFIDNFKTTLISELKKSYSLTTVDPQLITNENDLFYLDRSINFDNLNNFQIFQLVEFCDLYLISLIHELDFKGLIASYYAIERDKKQKFSRAVGEYKILIEKKILLVDSNYAIFEKIANELFNIINNIIKQLKLRETTLLPSKIYVIDFNDVKKMYPTIKKSDAIKQIVDSKQCVLFTNLDDTFDHIKRKQIVNFTFNATLYLKLKLNNEIVEVINFNICPKASEVIEKYKYHKKINDYLHTINQTFNDYNDVLGIEINFSRLLLFILNKLHISEVCPMNLNEDLKKEFIKNKLFSL